MNISKGPFAFLMKDLHLYAYKVQLTQALKCEIRQAANHILENEQVGEISKKLIFSHKAHFNLTDFINKQNCQIDFKLFMA